MDSARADSNKSSKEIEYPTLCRFDSCRHRQFFYWKGHAKTPFFYCDARRLHATIWPPVLTFLSCFDLEKWSRLRPNASVPFPFVNRIIINSQRAMSPRCSYQHLNLCFLWYLLFLLVYVRWQVLRVYVEAGCWVMTGSALIYTRDNSAFVRNVRSSWISLIYDSIVYVRGHMQSRPRNNMQDWERVK